MLEQKDITIGENNFQYSMMSAWDANMTLIQLKPLLTSAFNALNQGGAMEQDATKFISSIVDNITEELFESVVFKMFSRSTLICTNHKKRITNQHEFNIVFVGAAGLFDAYKLIFEILKANFSGFFTEAQGVYGGQASTAASISIPMTLAQ
ncbi:MAG: phage tail assembly chaperone [Vibrio sp.]